MSQAPTFDESWHRIEGRRVWLRPGVEIFPQRFRGQRWYVVRDALGNRFFRIRPPAYRFICELERSPTVGEAWERSLDASPEEAPGQGEVVQLLSQLNQAGLLRSDLEGDVAALFATQEKERQQQVMTQWSNLLFMRIPLINPDRFLQRTLPLVSWMISRTGLVVWLVLLALGGKAIAENWQQFRAEAGALLGATNLPLLYLAIIVIKGLHEFGHGYFCRKYGGEVPQMGIMLLIFNPLPYVDASSSWAFREKSKRALVGAAGMIVELFLASLAALVWANTGEGLAHAVAYNVVVIASVGTLVFNFNPLLRFDGYHIAADLLEVPNLQGRASRTTLYLVERYLFGLPHAINPAETKAGTFGLAAYFIASFIYRLLVLVGILLLVSRWFSVIGVLLAVVFAIVWLIVPTVKAMHFLGYSPRLEARRTRAVGVCVALVLGVIAAVALLPVPNHFRAEGVVRSDPYARIYVETTGQLSEILAPSGTMVKEGQPLVRMTNFELDRQIDIAELDIAKAEAQQREAFEQDPVRHLSLQGYLEAAHARLDKLAEQKRSLVISAPGDGRWIAPEIGRMTGATLLRGRELGAVEGIGRHYLAAEVRQADVARLFGGNVSGSGVKVRGLEDFTVAVSDLQAIPAELTPKSNGGQRRGNGQGSSDLGRDPLTSEPFFEIRVFLEPQPQVQLVHGQRGVARLDLPWEPLLSQWVRSVRQLFQRNYRV